MRRLPALPGCSAEILHACSTNSRWLHGSRSPFEPCVTGGFKEDRSPLFAWARRRFGTEPATSRPGWRRGSEPALPVIRNEPGPLSVASGLPDQTSIVKEQKMPKKSKKVMPKPTRLAKVASAIKPEKTHWLCEGRIAIGCVTVIAGEPGLGKSQIAARLAATVS